MFEYRIILEGSQFFDSLGSLVGFTGCYIYIVQIAVSVNVVSVCSILTV